MRGLAEDGFDGIALFAMSLDFGGGEGRVDEDAFVVDPGWRRNGAGGRGGVFGNLFDHVGAVDVEAGATGIHDGDVKAFEQESGAGQIDGIADQGVQDFHDGGLDGFLVFDEGEGMKASFRGSGNAAQHALVEVAEFLAAKSGGAATDAGDFDVGADADVFVNWHIHISGGVWIPFA